MEPIEAFRNAAGNPHEYGRRLKNQGANVLGYFCSYTPEEIIHAAGVHPMRLFGAQGDTGIADAHLQAYSCSLVREPSRMSSPAPWTTSTARSFPTRAIPFRGFPTSGA